MSLKIIIIEFASTCLGKDFQCMKCYLTFCCSCIKFVPEPEDSILLSTSLNIYRKFNHYSKALQLALQLNDLDLIREIFLSAKENP